MAILVPFFVIIFILAAFFIVVAPARDVKPKNVKDVEDVENKKKITIDSEKSIPLSSQSKKKK